MPLPLPVSMHAPVRKACPPGACVCERDNLQADAAADMRILMLTQAEEKRLIARIARIASYAELQHVTALLHAQLGIVLRIVPGAHEVRSMRGFAIQLEERRGLCKKTRKTIPAAVRTCLEQHPAIAYAILNAQGLLGEVESD